MNLIGNKFDKFDFLYNVASFFLYLCATVFMFNGTLEYLKENITYMPAPIKYLVAVSSTFVILVPFFYWGLRMHRSNKSKSSVHSQNYFLMMEKLCFNKCPCCRTELDVSAIGTDIRLFCPSCEFTAIMIGSVPLYDSTGNEIVGRKSLPHYLVDKSK